MPCRYSVAVRLLVNLLARAQVRGARLPFARAVLEGGSCGWQVLAPEATAPLAAHAPALSYWAMDVHGERAR